MIAYISTLNFKCKHSLCVLCYLWESKLYIANVSVVAFCNKILFDLANDITVFKCKSANKLAVFKVRSVIAKLCVRLETAASFNNIAVKTCHYNSVIAEFSPLAVADKSLAVHECVKYTHKGSTLTAEILNIEYLETAKKS